MPPNLALAFALPVGNAKTNGVTQRSSQHVHGVAAEIELMGSTRYSE